MGCNIRVDLSTGFPEYSNYLNYLKALQGATSDAPNSWRYRRGQPCYEGERRRAAVCFGGFDQTEAYHYPRVSGTAGCLSVLSTWRDGFDGNPGGFLLHGSKREETHRGANLLQLGSMSSSATVWGASTRTASPTWEERSTV